MATSTAFTRLAQSNGLTNYWAVYAGYGLTAADTMNLAADFVRVVNAYWVSSTGTVTAATMTVATVTSVTVPAGPANDDGIFIAFGARVQQSVSP